MHRGFFAQALEDCPNDPMGSKYSPSVLAAYGSATAFVGLIESLFNQHPALTERMWFLFTHVFSCAVCLWLLSGMWTNREFYGYIDCSRVGSSEIADGFGTLCTFTFGICVEPIFESIWSCSCGKNNRKCLTHCMNATSLWIKMH